LVWRDAVDRDKRLFYFEFQNEGKAGYLKALLGVGAVCCDQL